MNDNRNLILVGFMGTGKSTVGPLVASRLDRVFVDVDMAIQHRTGLTIPRLFANYSEPFFRAIEKGICHELMLEQSLVIATGGGAVIDDDTRRAFLDYGYVICLTASAEVIETRMRRTDVRPLAGEWRERLAKRQAVYDSLPNCIDTSDKHPESVVEEVLAIWESASR